MLLLLVNFVDFVETNECFFVNSVRNTKVLAAFAKVSFILFSVLVSSDPWSLLLVDSICVNRFLFFILSKLNFLTTLLQPLSVMYTLLLLSIDLTCFSDFLPLLTASLMSFPLSLGVSLTYITFTELSLGENLTLCLSCLLRAMFSILRTWSSFSCLFVTSSSSNETTGEVTHDKRGVLDEEVIFGLKRLKELMGVNVIDLTPDLLNEVHQNLENLIHLIVMDLFDLVSNNDN